MELFISADGAIYSGDCIEGDRKATAKEVTDYGIKQANAEIVAEIALLEATITPRRMREAIISADNGWLEAINE